MSPRAKPEAVDEEPTDEEHEETTARDAVMARLAAARSCAANAVAAIEEALDLFVDVEEDSRGKHRKELVQAALEHVGSATRALEMAESELPDIDPEECEPWEGDDEDEEDEDETANELPRATARARRS